MAGISVYNSWPGKPDNLPSQGHFPLPEPMLTRPMTKCTVRVVATNNARVALRRRRLTTRPTDLSQGQTTAPKRFPLNGFKHFLTLFSKFFSSFPHGTCSLSVSHPYLALDEVYHPFKAVLPNNPTRRVDIVCRSVASGIRGSHPLCRFLPENLHRHQPAMMTL